MLSVDIPGARSLRLSHLALDLNGTLTDRGNLIDGVGERLARVGRLLEVHVLSADTFGTLEGVAAALAVRSKAVATGLEKARFIARLGAHECVAIGNGANDAEMLAAAGLGIAVIGPEGAASPAIQAADLVCVSILDALDLVADKRALVATLRP